MKNTTGLFNLDLLDSTISDTAVQTITTETEHDTNLNLHPLFTALLCSRNVIEREKVHKSRKIVLQVNDTETNSHSLVDYTEKPVATANYMYHPYSKVGQIGLIHVDYDFQQYGIGLKLKKQIQNHLIQDGAQICYTWIASEGGRKLAEKTNYQPEKTIFPDIEEIWYWDTNS